jgi:hypothetical protein
MLKKIVLLITMYCFTACTSNLTKPDKDEDAVAQAPLSHEVGAVNESIQVDADWNKRIWQSINPLRIENQMGADPKFRPQTEVKMAYDSTDLYVIFKVDDRFVRSVTEVYNGPVYGDACVEFFFSPDSNQPLWYFNLEVNCGGIPLLHYVTKPREAIQKLAIEDIQEIEIAHSMPKVVDPEITEPVTWTLEYRIPFYLLEKYSKVSRPAPGVIWHANFYKTANQNSNPHYLTWSFVDHPKPNFHLPEYFGTLIFK